MTLANLNKFLDRFDDEAKEQAFQSLNCQARSQNMSQAVAQSTRKLMIDKCNVIESPPGPVTMATTIEAGTGEAGRNIARHESNGNRRGKGASQGTSQRQYQYYQDGQWQSAKPRPTLLDFVKPALPGGGRTPPTRSASITITASNGINNYGKPMWWEGVELHVKEPGKDPYPFSAQTNPLSMFHVSLNENLLQKGLVADRLDLARRELGDRPAIRLKFQPQHVTCRHSNRPFQRTGRVRMGTAQMLPVIAPPRPDHHALNHDEEQ